MNITETCDVWQKLKSTEKPIVLYGMGNGADKILSVMDTYGVKAADFFASDGFVRGHSFHGKRVLSFTEAREKYPDMLVVISWISLIRIHNIYSITVRLVRFAEKRFQRFRFAEIF